MVWCAWVTSARQTLLKIMCRKAPKVKQLATDWDADNFTLVTPSASDKHHDIANFSSQVRKMVAPGNIISIYVKCIVIDIDVPPSSVWENGFNISHAFWGARWTTLSVFRKRGHELADKADSNDILSNRGYVKVPVYRAPCFLGVQKRAC